MILIATPPGAAPGERVALEILECSFSLSVRPSNHQLVPCARCQATGVRENIRFRSAEVVIGTPTYSAEDHPERGQVQQGCSCTHLLRFCSDFRIEFRAKILGTLFTWTCLNTRLITESQRWHGHSRCSSDQHSATIITASTRMSRSSSSSLLLSSFSLLASN